MNLSNFYILSNDYLMINLCSKDDSESNDLKGAIFSYENDSQVIKISQKLWQLSYFYFKYAIPFSKLTQHFKLTEEESKKFIQLVDELQKLGAIEVAKTVPLELPITSDEDILLYNSSASEIGEKSIIDLDDLLNIQEELTIYATGCCGCSSSTC